MRSLETSRPAGHTLSNAASIAARVAYLGVVLIATLTDLDFQPDMTMVTYRLTRALDLTLRMRDAIDGARNMILFAGLGAVWVVSSRSERMSRATVQITLLGCALSVFVETLQLFSPTRTASLINVTTNMVGAIAGALLIDALILWIHHVRNRPSFIGVPTFTFAGAYLTATWFEAFMPLFRQNFLPDLGGGVRTRFHQAMEAVRLPSIAHLPVFDVILFAPAGVLAVAALIEAGVSYSIAWPIVVLAGAIISAVTEVAHGIAGQPIELGAVATHTLAIAGGAYAAARGLPPLNAPYAARRRARAIFIAYCALIALWSWRPFVLELNAASVQEQFSAVHWIPLRALAMRFDWFTVTDVVAQFLLYLPLGALLAVWPLRTRGAWRHLYPAIYLSFVMELGKIVIAERFFDVTHILIQTAGAAMGWIILRHAEYEIAGEVWSDAELTPSA